MDFTTILADREISKKLFDAGFFFGDLEGNYGFTSKPLRELGFSAEEMRSSGYQDRIHPDDRPVYLSLWERVSDGRDDELYCEYRLSDGEGRWHWIETHAVVVERQSDGSIGQIIGTDREITARKNAEEYLHREYRKTQRKYEIAESLRRTSTLVSADLQLTHSLGYGVEQLSSIVSFDRCDVYAVEEGSKQRLLRYPAEEDSATPDTTQMWKEVEASHYPTIRDISDVETPFRSWLGIPLRSERTLLGAVFLWHRERGVYSGEDLYPVSAFGDILTVAIQNNQYLKRTIIALESDELTGMLTRRGFFRDAPGKWREYCDRFATNGVAMIDIDNFKEINDTFGHPVGDEVLRSVARELTSSFREGDLLARYGGEEFVVILPKVTDSAAMQIMERIRERCCAREVPEVGRAVTVSVGLAVTSGAEQLEHMIARADDALYRAKRSGKNRVELFREAIEGEPR